ncbi:MAG TPA: 1-acyl-sn-glycerol-3-phosphate acyltransferase [Acidimicrobiia bacterium]|nr:1-acyl-sn-glycerol-3-phosphate acyltransferase [Acidimicrobiia bacterium]
MPPRLARRIFIAPLVPVATLLGIALFPVELAAVAVASRYLPGRLKAPRLLWVVMLWLVRESIGIVLLFALWLASGCGWRLRAPPFRRQHVRLISWYLWGVIGTAQRSLGLRLVTEESPGTLVVEPHLTSRPLLVLSRHAGAGDSLILAHELVNTYGRTPSVVLKDTLKWAPCLDVILHRLPNRFIPPNPPPGAGVVESIGALAARLPDDGALILFPEGGNFTESRRQRAIQRLVERGLHAEAVKARGLSMVLPPRPGGTLAALASARHADVVFVAHTGLEHLSSMRQVLEGVPMGHSVRMAWWLVRAEDIPQGEEARIVWLFDWWNRIDEWVRAHAEAGLQPATRLSPEPGPAPVAARPRRRRPPRSG